MRLKYLIKSLEKASIVKRGKYSYIVHPITDGIPEIKPELLKEVTHEMQKFMEKCGKIDKILTIEAMGIPLATTLSLNMNIPFSIIRKRRYGLPDEVSVRQVTGYSKSKLYINGLEKKDKIIIVDDVLSTGGTLRTVLKTLKKMGVVVKGVFIVVDKGDSVTKIKNESGVEITALVNIDIIDEGSLLPPLERGTRLIISPVGAYNNTQWLQFIEYRPNIVLISEDGEVELIREAEDLSDIDKHEILPERLNNK